ncbi:hypothetical protein EB118_16620 [bacterium]|nr:hypothetical protein [bacterium]NDC95424.1 hypothetical protein [bacterium]NDD85157.1 hypothetical protein [bacterium]NDG31679.1 hypothetical protein [bacterium]
MSHDPKKINRDYASLAPFFSQRLQMAIQEAQDQGLSIDFFEGYRSPNRQDYLFEQGRTREGKIITKARAFQSWHQYGVAADLCFKIDGKWAWSKSDPWDKVHEIMDDFGFEMLSWEKAHVQITAGMSISKAEKIVQDHGLMVLWSIIESDRTGPRN